METAQSSSDPRTLEKPFCTPVVSTMMSLSPCWNPGAALSSVKHLSRDHRCHRHHYVLVGKNIEAVLASSKIRCASILVLRLLQILCAETIASNIVVHHRWISSELNRADQLSGSLLWCEARSPVASAMVQRAWRQKGSPKKRCRN